MWQLIYYYLKNFQLFIQYTIENTGYQIATIMATAGTDFCLKLYLLICLAIIHYLSIYIFIKAVGYSIYFIYFRLTYILRENPSLYHSPYFAQIDDYVYYNKYFCTEKFLFYFIIYSIICGLCIYYIYIKTNDKINGDKTVLGFFSNQMKFLGFAFILSLIFIIAFNYSILRTSSVINEMMNNIYNNLNAEYIMSVCEYTENTSKSIDFIYGMCNNLQSNKKKLWQYISEVSIKWGNNYPGYNAIIYENKDNVKYAKELLMEQVDENGVSYYNKILRAMLTFSLINYFIENNLNYEAQRFFSLENVLKGYIHDKQSARSIFSGLFSIFTDRENPFLYLKNNNLMLVNYVFSYDTKSRIDKKIFDLLVNDYDDIKDNITNGIITAYDILNYKMTPSAYFHILIALFSILMIISKFVEFSNLNKK